MKFCGYVGFWEGDKETSKNVYTPSIVERKYVGEVIQNYQRFSSNEFQNDDFKVTNKISILSDLYAQQNFMSIRYIVWHGKALKVTTVEMAYPRIIIDIGGIYNGKRPEGTR